MPRLKVMWEGVVAKTSVYCVMSIDVEYSDYQNQILPTCFVDVIRKKAKIRHRYNQVPHLTHDTVWESEKYIRKFQIQDQPFPSRGDHKAARYRQVSMAKIDSK